ncbi:MAG: hypothetical protein WA058_00190 [Minisyncoccia bacterium]
MNVVGALIKKLAENDILHLRESIFALGPEYRPQVNANRIEHEPLSLIIGEHPSEYSVSPLMWNAELKFRGAKGVFIPIDIPAARARDVRTLLDIAFAAGAEHFRVLTITNPYKIQALDYFREQALKFRGRVNISEDADLIGATNQILVDRDNVFHVINSDGQGMANAIGTYLAEQGMGEVKNKRIGIIGAGGASRGIMYELAKRMNRGSGSIALFNRTEAKAIDLVRDLSQFFRMVLMTAHPLSELADVVGDLEVLVSCITEGNPLAEYGIYEMLRPGTLIVDANYGKNSVLASGAAQAGRDDLVVRDGAGMVVEGYRIPSRTLSNLWRYSVPASTYTQIGKLFGYVPRRI